MEELTELLQRVLRNDENACATLVRRFQRMALECAHAILGDYHLAEDACQESFVEVFRHLPKLRVHECFPVWFRRIVRTQCHRIVRRRRCKIAYGECAEAVPTGEDGPATRAEIDEIRTRVRETLSMLPRKSRTTAMLYYIDGFDYREVADRVEAPLGTVKRRLHDSRKRLRKQMVGLARELWLDGGPERVPSSQKAAPAKPASGQRNAIRRTKEHDGDRDMTKQDIEEALAVFWATLGRLQDAGLPVVRSLRTIAEEADTPVVKALADCLATCISRGHTLAEAMRALGVFLPTEIEMVETGCERGVLDRVLPQIASRLRDAGRLGRRPAITVGALKRACKETGPPDTAKKAKAVVEAAVRQRSTDIHIDPCEEGFAIRYRIDGALQDVETLAGREGISLCMSLKELANLNLAERRLPQRGRTAFIAKSGKKYQLRISVMPAEKGESLVIRLLEDIVGELVLPRLFSAGDAEALTEAITRPWGIIFIGGPVGSGKTTVLYAALNHIMATGQGLKINSVEDPIEYPLPGVTQTEVDASIGLTAPVALRHLLQSDPDVILVGHGPDEETAGVMVEAALTGHLLLTTLHASDAFDALRQVTELIPRRDYLADAVAVVTGQRLVRKLCPACKAEYQALSEEMKALRLDENVGDVSLWQAKGCAKCRKTGYRGRIGVVEVLRLEGEVADAIRSGAELAEIREAALRTGMKTMSERGLALAREGVTTLDEVTRVCGS